LINAGIRMEQVFPVAPVTNVFMIYKFN